MATRDQILANMGMPLASEQMYERHKLRRPADDEDVIVPPSISSPMFAKHPRQIPIKASLPDDQDPLVKNVMEDLTGVASDWLGPVRPIFADLISKAQDGSITDAEFIQAVEKLSTEMPELFDRLNHQSLQDSLEKSMTASAINGAFDRFNTLPEEALQP